MLNLNPINNTKTFIKFHKRTYLQIHALNQNLIYINRPFDKGRLKVLLHWSFSQLGEKKTVDLVEHLKRLGYSYATKAGLSLSIEDLLIPQTKKTLLISTQKKLQQTQDEVEKGLLTTIEYVAQVLDKWNATSEQLKDEVIANFKSKDILNPVYMMAFSGARGNISQVRQLTGMRGLMADPSGQIIDFPIESNFREGLTLTEYMISCYGARKGVVDTALRTATSGYLTRRLVDSAHHVVIQGHDCETTKGIVLSTLQSTNKTILKLKPRLVGRVLAKPVYNTNHQVIAFRNEEISHQLASRLTDFKTPILLRSPMTCNGDRVVCQLCYGWSLAVNRLVSIGESVGIIAAQSIGEPGTQLTMRTFHTGGVFSSDVTDQICAPFTGLIVFPKAVPGHCVRTAHGQVAFLTKEATSFFLKAKQNFKISLEPYSLLFVKQNQVVQQNQVLAEFSVLQKMDQTINAVSTIYSTLSGEIKFTNAQTVHLGHDKPIQLPSDRRVFGKFVKTPNGEYLEFISKRLNSNDFIAFVSNGLNKESFDSFKNLNLDIHESLNLPENLNLHIDENLHLPENLNLDVEENLNLDLFLSDDDSSDTDLENEDDYFSFDDEDEFPFTEDEFPFTEDDFDFPFTEDDFPFTEDDFPFDHEELYFDHKDHFLLEEIAFFPDEQRQGKGKKLRLPDNFFSFPNENAPFIQSDDLNLNLNEGFNRDSEERNQENDLDNEKPKNTSSESLKVREKEKKRFKSFKNDNLNLNGKDNYNLESDIEASLSSDVEESNVEESDVEENFYLDIQNQSSLTIANDLTLQLELFQDIKEKKIRENDIKAYSLQTFHSNLFSFFNQEFLDLDEINKFNPESILMKVKAYLKQGGDLKKLINPFSYAYKLKQTKKQTIQNLNVYPGEFWILAAQKQKFLNQNNSTMVQQGDWLQHEGVLMSSEKIRFKPSSTLALKKKRLASCTGIFQYSSLQNPNFSKGLRLQNILKKKRKGFQFQLKGSVKEPLISMSTGIKETGSHRIIHHSFFQWNHGIKNKKSLKKNKVFKSFANFNQKLIITNPIKFFKERHNRLFFLNKKKQKDSKQRLNPKKSAYPSLSLSLSLNLNPMTFKYKRNPIKNFLVINKRVLNLNSQSNMSFIKRTDYIYSQKVYDFFLNSAKQQNQRINPLFLFKETYVFPWTKFYLKRLESQCHINNTITYLNSPFQTFMTKNTLKKGYLENQKTDLNLTNISHMNSFYKCNYTCSYLGMLTITKQLVSNYMWYSRLNLMSSKQWFMLQFLISNSMRLFNSMALKLIQIYFKLILDLILFKHRINGYRNIVCSHVKILKSYRQTRVHSFPIDHKMIQEARLKQISWPFSKTHIQIIQPFMKNLQQDQSLLNRSRVQNLFKKNISKAKINKAKIKKANKSHFSKINPKVSVLKKSAIKKSKSKGTKKLKKRLDRLVINQKKLLNFIFYLQIKYQKDKMYHAPVFLFVCHIMFLKSTLNTIKLWISNLKRWQKLERALQLKSISKLKKVSNNQLKNVIDSNNIKPMLGLKTIQKDLTNEIKLNRFKKLAYFLNFYKLAHSIKPTVLLKSGIKKHIKHKTFKVKVLHSFAWLNSDSIKQVNTAYFKLTPFYLNVKVPPSQTKSSLFVQWYDSKIKNDMTLNKSYLFKMSKTNKSSLPFTIKTYNYKENNALYSEPYMIKAMFKEFKTKLSLKLQVKNEKDLQKLNAYKSLFFNHWSTLDIKLKKRVKGFHNKMLVNLAEINSNKPYAWFIQNHKLLNNGFLTLNKTKAKTNRLSITVNNLGILPYFSLFKSSGSSRLSDMSIQKTFSSISLARLQNLGTSKLQKSQLNLNHKNSLIQILTLKKLDPEKPILKLKSKLTADYRKKKQNAKTNFNQKLNWEKSKAKSNKKSLNSSKPIKNKTKLNNVIKQKVQLQKVRNTKALGLNLSLSLSLTKRFKNVLNDFTLDQQKNQVSHRPFPYDNVKLTQYYGWVYAINNVYFDQKKLIFMGMKTTGLFDNRLLVRRNFALTPNITTYQSGYKDVWKTMLFTSRVLKFNRFKTIFEKKKQYELLMKPIFSAYTSLFTKYYIEKNLITDFNILNPVDLIDLTNVYSLALQFYSDVIYLKKANLKLNKKKIGLKFTLDKDEYKDDFTMKLKQTMVHKQKQKQKGSVKTLNTKASKKKQNKQMISARRKLKKRENLKQFKISNTIFNKSEALGFEMKNRKQANRFNSNKLNALNIYYRLCFLKNSRMPLIKSKVKFKALSCLKKDNPIDRILLLNSLKIYCNQYSRYKPELLLNKLCYKPSIKTDRGLKENSLKNKRSLNVLFKMNQVLAVLQKPEEVYPQSVISEQHYDIQKQALNLKLKTNNKALLNLNPIKLWFAHSDFDSSGLKPKYHLSHPFSYTTPLKINYHYYEFFIYNQALESKSQPLMLETLPQLKNYNQWFNKIEPNKMTNYKSFWTRFRYNILLNKLLIKKQKVKGLKTLNKYSLDPFLTKQNAKLKQVKLAKRQLKNNPFEENSDYFLRYSHFCFKMVSLQSLHKRWYKTKFKLNLNVFKRRFQLKNFLIEDFLTPLHCLLLLKFNKTLNLTSNSQIPNSKMSNSKIKPEVLIKKRAKTAKHKKLVLEKAKKTIQKKATKKLKQPGSQWNKKAYIQKTNRQQNQNKAMFNGVPRKNLVIFSNSNKVMFKQAHHLRVQADLFKPGFSLNLFYSQPQRAQAPISSVNSLSNKSFEALPTMVIKPTLTKQKTEQINANQGELLTSTTYWQGLDSWTQLAMKQTTNLLLPDKQILNVDLASLNYRVKPVTEIITLTNEDLLSYRIGSLIDLNALDLKINIGDFVSFATQCFSTHCFSESGQILEITKNKLVLRRAKKFALSAGSSFNLEHNNFINQNAALLKLNYKQIVNEDIIQGIPRIERLFEARSIRPGFTLAHLLKQRFQTMFDYYFQNRYPNYRHLATVKAIEFIQHYTLDAIQSVYQSQGVTIADKHVEIIIKQMTSKVIIIEPGTSDFLRGDLIPYQFIVKAKQKNALGKNLYYQPFILGITQTSLKADGFISAASFQETVNVLTQATYFRKTDFLLGLKEKVILGGLIPCGTGFPLFASKWGHLFITKFFRKKNVAKKF